MNNSLKKLTSIATNSSNRVLLAAVVAIQVIVIALIAFASFRCAVESFTIYVGQLAWNQLSTPSPPTPAGDITMQVIRIWMNHVVEVKLPQILQAMASLRKPW